MDKYSDNNEHNLPSDNDEDNLPSATSDCGHSPEQAGTADERAEPHLHRLESSAEEGVFPTEQDNTAREEPPQEAIPLTRDYIGHTGFLEANECIEECHRSLRSKERLKYARLQGVSGVGKTSVMERYRDRHPMHRTKEGWVIPVLYVPIPPNPTTSNLWTAMLSSMQSPDSASGTADAKELRLLALFHACKVELLLIDETQHFVARGSAKAHNAVAEALKSFIDKIKIPCVMGGAPMMRKLFDLNNQLRNRFMRLQPMKPFDGETPEGLEMLQGFVCLLVEDNEAFRPFLEYPGIFERVFYATDGVPRQVVDMLRHLRDHMSEKNVDWSLDLSAKLFGKYMWPSVIPRDNPFCLEFAARRLNATGEPFVPSEFDGDNHA